MPDDRAAAGSVAGRNWLHRLTPDAFRLWLIMAVVAMCSAPVAQAQVFPVEPIEKSILFRSAPSMTLYWQGKASKALLMFVPGGEGRIGLVPGLTDHPYHFHQTLRRLSDPAFTSGQIDVVLFDSPAELSPRQSFPSERGSTEHMVRIESALRFYKERTGLPVWLMGHSNGGISLTEFRKYLQKNKRLDLVSGMIVSGARKESYFDGPIPFPMLFIHHQDDACASTPPSAMERVYQKVRESNPDTTGWALLTSGMTQGMDPCRSGHHMYFGAAEEASRAIEAFMLRFHP